MKEPSWTDEDRLTVAALLAGLQSDDLICCYGGRVTQDNVIDLSINVLFNLISASVAEDELNRDCSATSEQKHNDHRIKAHLAQFLKRKEK